MNPSSEQRFAAVEKFLRSFVPRLKQKSDCSAELEIKASGLEWVRSKRLAEKWTQQYVEAEYRHLGFTKIQGPFPKGPDFRVMRKGHWEWAEVETKWQRYLEHGHHRSPAFADVQYLIVLSNGVPPPAKREQLPPNIVYIDHDHFVSWFEPATRNKFRIEIVASEMQKHFLTVCSDTERDGATCPQCDDCCYFGNGLQNEASPFFSRVAAGFIAVSATDNKQDVDLRRVDVESMRRYLERQMWNM